MMSSPHDMVFEVIDVEGIVGWLEYPEVMAILLDAGAESLETTVGTVGVG